VNLAAAAEAATARQGSTGRAVLVASLSRAGDEQVATVLGGLLDMPAHSTVTEPARPGWVPSLRRALGHRYAVALGLALA